LEAGKIEFFGSLADLETRGVQNMMVKMENQDHGRRTASERWKLFKLVSRIGHQLYRNWPTIECQKKVILKTILTCICNTFLPHNYDKKTGNSLCYIVSQHNELVIT